MIEPAADDVRKALKFVGEHFGDMPKERRKTVVRALAVLLREAHDEGYELCYDLSSED